MIEPLQPEIALSPPKIVFVTLSLIIFSPSSSTLIIYSYFSRTSYLYQKYEKMPIQIDIPDAQIDRLKEIYTSLAQEILGRLEKVQQEWTEIQPTLAQLGIKINAGTKRIKLKPIDKPLEFFAVDGAYNADWNWAKKAAYVLRLKGKPMTAKQILKVLIDECEPSLDQATATNSLPSTLSVQARKNNFSRVLENGEYIYDLVKKDETNN